MPSTLKPILKNMKKIDTLQNALNLASDSHYGVYMYKHCAEIVKNADSHTCENEALQNILTQDPNNNQNEFYWEDVISVLDCTFTINGIEYIFLQNEDIWYIEKSVFESIDYETLERWMI